MPFDTTVTTEDARSTELTVGIEVEYPQVDADSPTFRLPAKPTHGLYDRVYDATSRDWPLGGDVTSDGSAGLEINSNRRSIFSDDAAGWFSDTVVKLQSEYGTTYEPTSIMHPDGRGTSFGMHIHMSKLSEEQARDLYELSQDPLVQLFCCSSLAEGDEYQDYKVFRSNRYARFDGFDNRRTTAVHSCNGEGHYEWRVPEPLTERHMAHLMEFLHEFHQHGPTAARRYAYSVLKRNPDVVTAVKRARTIGVDKIEGVDEHEWQDVSVNDGIGLSLNYEIYDFYRTLDTDGSLPSAYRVSLENDTEYIAANGNGDSVFEHDGREFDLSNVFVAGPNGIEAVSDDEIADRVRSAIEASRSGQLDDDQEPPKTETTETLLKEVKKM